MHILVTNDDGVTEPGLLALAKAMRYFGKVSITPLHLDLTEYHRAEQLKRWRWQDGEPTNDNGHYSPSLMALHL